jgi:hypothetical protein
LLGSSDYPVCGSCGEHFREALVTSNDKTSCRNCSSVSARRWRCPFCQRHGMPFQLHHSAGRELSPVMVVACLNCHAVLTSWQTRRKRRLKAQGLDVRDTQFNLCFYGYEDLARLYRLRNGEKPVGECWEYYIER